MINHQSNHLQSLAQPIDAASKVASLEYEMPLLVAIARELSQREDDLFALLPAARKLLEEAFHASVRRHEVMQLEVA